MRTLALLLLLLLPQLLLPTGTALAQDAIHRCVDASGNPVFTDRTCASQHATPVTASASAPTSTGTPPPMPPATLCAATLPALKQAVIDAFAGRDPNRLAGLMLWGGYGHHAVVADIRSLGQLMRQPLLGIHAVGGGDSDDTPASAASIAGESPADAPTAPALVLRTSDPAGGPPQQSTYPVVARAGCLWLRPPG